MRQIIDLIAKFTFILAIPYVTMYVLHLASGHEMNYCGNIVSLAWFIALIDILIVWRSK